MRAFVKQPAAVVVLLVVFAVTAHAASIVGIQTFTSRDLFQSVLAGPSQLAFNFHSQPEGLPDTTGFLSVGGFSVIGDFRISSGAINFTAAANPSGSFLSNAINFNGNLASYFGADILAVSQAGRYNFSVGFAGGGFSESRSFSLPTFTTTNFTSPLFIGFASDIPFVAINFTFTPFPITDGVPFTEAFNFVLDNFVANTVSGVPEPSTLLLLGAGAVLGLVRLYTRRRAADAHPAGEGEKSDPT